MTDATELPQPSRAPVTRQWRVELADKTTRTIEARGFRVEHGALVLVLPLGCAAVPPRARTIVLIDTKSY